MSPIIGMMPIASSHVPSDVPTIRNAPAAIRNHLRPVDYDLAEEDVLG